MKTVFAVNDKRIFKIGKKGNRFVPESLLIVLSGDWKVVGMESAGCQIDEFEISGKFRVHCRALKLGLRHGELQESN